MHTVYGRLSYDCKQFQNSGRMCWRAEKLPGVCDTSGEKQYELYNCHISESHVQLTDHGELHFIVRLC